MGVPLTWQEWHAIAESRGQTIDRLAQENAKLRELIKDIWREGAFEPGACYAREAERLEERTRELGIEVE